MPTRNIDLTAHYDLFIEDRIAKSRFSDASGAVRAGLHLLEQQDAENEARLEWLRGAVQEGIDAIRDGDYIILNSAEDIDALMDDIHREVMAEAAAGPRSA